MTDTNENSLGTMKYYPYGSTRSGSVPTDELFTGQKLDGTGLYYYGARYYDPMIGRFISPDTIIPNPADPQSFNRYSYCLNNPLKYIDPSGHEVVFSDYEAEYAYNYAINGQYCQLVGIAWRIQALRNGWEALKTANSKLTTYLEESDQVVTYSFDPRMSGYGGTMPADDGNMDIWINPQYVNPTDLAQIQGHEGLHASVQDHRYLDADDTLRKSNNYWLYPSLAREAFAGSFEYLIAMKLGVEPLRPLSADLAKLVQPPLGDGIITDGYLGTTMSSIGLVSGSDGILAQMGYNVSALPIWPNNIDLEVYLGYVKDVW